VLHRRIGAKRACTAAVRGWLLAPSRKRARRLALNDVFTCGNRWPSRAKASTLLCTALSTCSSFVKPFFSSPYSNGKDEKAIRPDLHIHDAPTSRLL
jgi:hypothetical protein